MIKITPELAQRIANLLTDPRTVAPTGEAIQIIGALQAAAQESAEPETVPASKGNGSNVVHPTS